MIAPILARELCKSRSVATFLGRNQSVYEDVDGVFFWDYLSVVNKHLYEKQFKVFSYVGAIEFVYKTLQKRFVILTHKRQIDAKVARRIRELHSLAIYLSHKLETYDVDMRTVVTEVEDWYAQLLRSDR